MSIKHSWNGTTLTVVSDSGTSAADLKGDRGDTGPRGPQGPCGIVYDGEGNIIMDGYATEQYVNDLMDEVDRKLENVDVDLSGYATESYVDNAVQNVDVDLSGYATETYVSEEIAKAQLEGADIDTSNFVMKSELPEADGTTIVLNKDGKLSSAIGGGVSGYECYRLDWNWTDTWFSFNDDYLNWYGEANTAYTVKIVYVDGVIDVFNFIWPELKYNASVNDTLKYTHTPIYGETTHIKDIVMISSNYEDKTKLEWIAWGRTKPDSYEAQIPIKDVYIVKGALSNFDDGVIYTTINPYVVPVDESTIIINSEGKLSALAGGTVNLGDYYTKAEVDGKLPNIDTYATKEYVDDKIQYSTVDIGVGASLASGRLYVVYE